MNNNENPQTQDGAPEAQPQTENSSGVSQQSVSRNEPVFTQEQLNSIAANIRRQTENKLLARIAELETKINQTNNQQGGNPSSTKNATTSTEQADEMPEWARKLQQDLQATKVESQFKDALLDLNVTLNRDQREIVKTLFDAQRPEDPVSFLKETVEKLGIKTAGSDSPSQQPDSSTAQSQDPGPPASHAPVSVEDIERSQIHPNHLSAEQIASMGEKKLLEYTRKFFGNG